MNRLVIIRVGEPQLWQTSVPLGRWSSPELHLQTVRSLFVEGYTVIALFVGRGDTPLGAARITSVRGRTVEDTLPLTTDLGELRTFLEFDPTRVMFLQPTFTVTHFASIDYIKYMIGSQIAIPPNIAREFIQYFLHMTGPLNTTFIVPNNVNYII